MPLIKSQTRLSEWINDRATICYCCCYCCCCSTTWTLSSLFSFNFECIQKQTFFCGNNNVRRLQGRGTRWCVLFEIVGVISALEVWEGGVEETSSRGIKLDYVTRCCMYSSVKPNMFFLYDDEKTTHSPFFFLISLLWFDSFTFLFVLFERNVIRENTLTFFDTLKSTITNRYPFSKKPISTIQRFAGH